MSEKYHVVAAASELEATGQLHVDINGEEILLVRDGDDYHAVSYYCSHESLTLEGGHIANGCITCPYHGAEFNLSTGDALAPPAWEPIATYPVRVEDNLISIGLQE